LLSIYILRYYLYSDKAERLILEHNFWKLAERLSIIIVRVDFKIYTQTFWIAEYEIYTQIARDQVADCLSI